MATFYSTCESLASLDGESLSKELYKVYNDQNQRIPVLYLSRMVNDSWSSRNVKQFCMKELVEIGDNWEGKSWPI